MADAPTFLLLGQTGAGKSSFVNATFGKELAETDDFQACTKLVAHYHEATGYGRICLIDTPGLAENTDALDQKYLAMVRDALAARRNVVTLYISPLNATRLGQPERATLHAISRELGAAIWCNVWLVLTFGALVKPHKLYVTAEARQRLIREYIAGIPEARFPGFQRVICVDSIATEQWIGGAVPIAAALARGVHQ